jgi:hypothetical protein
VVPKKTHSTNYEKKAVIGQHWFQASSLFGFARLVFFTHKKISITQNLKGKIKGKFHKEK